MAVHEDRAAADFDSIVVRNALHTLNAEALRAAIDMLDRAATKALTE